MNSKALKILIPVDGSPTSEAILPALLPLIKSHDVESTLLQVVGAPDDGTSASRLDLLRRSLEAQGVAARVLILSGKAAAEIVGAAVRGRFDLIAMGTHGRTRLDRIIMGSVAEEVVRTSPVPVLLARPDCRIGSWDSIVVALDGTPGGEEILTDVVRLARAIKAVVHLVRVNRPLRVEDDYAAVPLDFPKPDTVSYLNQIACRLQEQGIQTAVEPIQGEPGPEISRVARSLGAGLICMTTEGRPASAPGGGNSVAAEVMRTSPCALYVRHMAGARGLRREGA
jgi:nucleotide-binding universal stress UspA family protein